jgi:hypothetical protein
VLLTDGAATFPGGEIGAWSQMFGAGGVADQLVDKDLTVHTITLGASGHWNDPCADPGYAEMFHRVRYPGHNIAADGCGVGQSLAHMTGGQAVRVEGYWANVQEAVLDAFLDEVAPPSGFPFVVAVGQ